VDEFELIRRFFVREDEVHGVVAGIGDDGAVLSPEPDLDLVNVIDTLVEDVHFPSDIDPADLGYRVVAVNLSDVAAMGGRPRWMTLALTLSAADELWLTQFSEGLFAAASEHEVALVGGDTTSGVSMVATVQITGDVARGKAIRRSGAKPGDTIYVTGTVGDAAAGLDLIRSGKPDEFLAQRYLRPSARVAAGRSLVDLASAAIDVSDGLVGDLGKLLSASGVGAELDVDAVPMSDALRSAFDADTRRRFALTGGDDYELCFTSSESIPDELADVPVTRIGTITANPDLVCRDSNGVVEADDSGYRHFR
jgi:thiamine-monophosphate kinase